MMANPKLIGLALLVLVCWGCEPYPIRDDDDDFEGGGAQYDPGGPPVSSGDDPCDQLTPQSWTGLAACEDIGSLGRFVSGRLQTFWQTGPDVICAYFGQNGVQGPCGQLPPGGAFYCSLDNSIAWDIPFMENLYYSIGDFGSATVVAHEWGHLLQARLGVSASTTGAELNADCAAGVFAAFEEASGLLKSNDIPEAFYAFCRAGDTEASSWFNPGTHGSCQQRMDAFGFGYQTALSNLDIACGADRLDAFVSICGTP